MRPKLVLFGLGWLVLQTLASASVTNRFADVLPGALADWTTETPVSKLVPSGAPYQLAVEPSAAQIQPLDFTPDPSWVDVAIQWNIPYDQLHPLNQRLL